MTEIPRLTSEQAEVLDSLIDATGRPWILFTLRGSHDYRAALALERLGLLSCMEDEVFRLTDRGLEVARTLRR